MFAKAIGVDFQKILYIKSIGLLDTTSEVVKRFGLTECSQVRSPRCNPAYFSTIEELAEFIWPHQPCVAS